MKRGFYGLLGEKLSHSISPQIHSIILEKMGLEGCYNIFEVEKGNMANAVRGLEVLGCSGANVTIPYKQEVMESLAGIYDEARRIGAVNTIDFRNKRPEGHNTDYHGFKMLLDRFEVPIEGRSFAVLGSGGAAKAVVKCLEDFGAARIVIVSRNAAKAAKEFKGVEAVSYEGLKKMDAMDTAINCTPCGMYPKIDHSPLDKKAVSRFSCVVDLIYNPDETKLMKHAKEQGIKSANGLYMLVGQAVKAQEIWNDIRMEKDSVEDIYESVKKILKGD